MTEAFICNTCETVRSVTEPMDGWRTLVAVSRGIRNFTDPEQIAKYDFCSWECCATFAAYKAKEAKK